MRLYQKQAEKYLNKEYAIPFEEFLSELKNVVPGKAEIIKVDTVQDKKYGQIEVYNLFNMYEESENINEEEWNKTCEVFLEFWKIDKPNGNFIIQ
jgi:hypothetical protein